MEHTIKMDEISIDSGQYLPIEFGKCHHIHGHTYRIRNFQIKTRGIVDFANFKRVYSQFDHVLIAPECDRHSIEMIINFMNENAINIFEIIPLYIPYEYSAVEYIGDYLKKKFLEIPGVLDTSFTIYETPNAGAVIDWTSDTLQE